MTVKIKIQNTEISFPTTGESPNWAPAIVQFALAVENALNATIGPYDVAPQIQSIDDNGISDVVLTNLSFPTQDVSQVVIDYAIQRRLMVDDGTSINEQIYTEGGVITATYRPEDNKWDFTQTKTGNAKAEFSIDNSGQVKVTFYSIPGEPNTHTGHVSFRARALSSHD